MSEIRQNNLTLPSHGYVKMSRSFLGYHLHSYVRMFEINLTATKNITEIKLILQGLNHNATLRLTSAQCISQGGGRHCVILHEKYTQENLTANQMQSLLADVNEANLRLSGDLGNETLIDVVMGTAVSGRQGDEASHVERCECPGHYKDLSCQNCNAGNPNIFSGFCKVMFETFAVKETTKLSSRNK